MVQLNLNLGLGIVPIHWRSSFISSSFAVFQVLWFQDGSPLIVRVPRWFTCDNSCPGDHSEEFNIRGPQPPSNKPPPPLWPQLAVTKPYWQVIRDNLISMWSKGIKGEGEVSWSRLTSVLTWTQIKTSLGPSTQWLLLAQITRSINVLA